MNATILKSVTTVLVLMAVSCAQQPVRENRTVTIVAVNFDQWQQKLSSYKGEIVVVDLWATWCRPCVESFPHMMKMYKKYSPRGVRFVSMNLDDRSDAQAVGQALDFLVKQNAAFDNYRMDERTPDAFEKLDLQDIPAVLIYDRAGKLRRRLTVEDPNVPFTDADVEKAILELLASA